MQFKTKSISKYLSQQTSNETKLEGKTASKSNRTIKKSLQTCKSLAKIGLAISISTVSVLLAGQPQKAQATTSPNPINNGASSSSQNKTSKQNNLVRENKLFNLRRNPLARLNITENIYKNISAKLPVIQVDRPIELETTNIIKTNNFSTQHSSLLTKQNWSSATEELSSSRTLPILPNAESKEYIFKLPALENNRIQQSVAQNIQTKIHIVQPGDTINKIAERYGISRQQLIEANKIYNPNLIFVSQRLRIPQTKTSPQNLQNTAQNNLTRVVTQNSDRTQNLTQPSSLPQLSGLDNSVTEGEEATIANPLGMTIKLSASITPKLPPLSSPEQYLPASPAEFDGYIWPARGTMTSGYGWRWGRPHKGIDIAAPIGTPIMAAASGEVISAGWNSGGYGNLVKVKHPNGSVTFYAHNHKIMVRSGQQVKQGQQIAQMGSTGFSTGSHLHFEIRPNGSTAVNPIAYLPGK